jgi:hypothetical protein
MTIMMVGGWIILSRHGPHGGVSFVLFHGTNEKVVSPHQHRE